MGALDIAGLASQGTPLGWLSDASMAAGALGSISSLIGGNRQSQAAQQAIQAEQNMFNTVNSNSQPYLNAGSAGANQLKSMIPQLSSSFTNADLNANLAPNYGFMLQQGQGTVNHMNNATGGLVSGNSLQGLDQWTQNYAQNAYQQAFNNFQNNNNNIYNRLSGIAGIGATANQTVAGAASNAANSIGSALGYGANAQANAINGATNSLSSAITTPAAYNYLSSMMPNNNNSGANTQVNYGPPPGSGAYAQPTQF